MRLHFDLRIWELWANAYTKQRTLLTWEAVTSWVHSILFCSHRAWTRFLFAFECLFESCFSGTSSVCFYFVLPGAVHLQRRSTSSSPRASLGSHAPFGTALAVITHCSVDFRNDSYCDECMNPYCDHFYYSALLVRCTVILSRNAGCNIFLLSPPFYLKFPFFISTTGQRRTIYPPFSQPLSTPQVLSMYGHVICTINAIFKDFYFFLYLNFLFFWCIIVIYCDI